MDMTTRTFNIATIPIFRTGLDDGQDDDGEDKYLVFDRFTKGVWMVAKDSKNTTDDKRV